MRFVKLMLAAFLAVVGSAIVGLAVDAGEKELLLGNWACESGDCPDEEISFSIEDGEQIYRSWLHARPSAVDGTWRLDGDVLVVECCGGLRYEWILVEVGEKQLRLQEKATSEEAVFSRIEM